MTAEMHFNSAPAAVAFEAAIAAQSEKLIAATKNDNFATRWAILGYALEGHRSNLQTITVTRFDTIRALWTYQTGSTKVHVRI